MAIRATRSVAAFGPERQAIEANWDNDVGDCRQELVFIGQNIDYARLARELDACLLTDQEMALGRDAWNSFNDPFGLWLENQVA